MPKLIPHPLRILVLALLALSRHLDAMAQEPYSTILTQTDTVYWYTIIPFSIPVKAGPRGAKITSSPGARLVPADPTSCRYQLVIDAPEEGTTPIVVTARHGRRSDADTVVLMGERPYLRTAKIDRNGNTYSGTNAWRGMRGTIGKPYDPTSEWASPFIPANHYQTIVTIGGREVLNQAGTRFRHLPIETMRAMTITEGMRPEDILTHIYWRPNGTSDRARWVLLLSNQPDPRALIPLEGAMRIGFPVVDGNDDAREFTVVISPDHPIDRTPEFRLSEELDDGDHPIVKRIECGECDKYGIAIGLETTDPLHGSLRVEARAVEVLLSHRRELNGRLLPIYIFMEGARGGITGTILLTLVPTKEKQ